MSDVAITDFVYQGDGTWSIDVGHGSPVKVLIDQVGNAYDVHVIESSNQDIIRYIGTANTLADAKLFASYIVELHRKNIKEPVAAG